MSDTERPVLLNPRRLTQIGAACAVLWLAIVSIFRAEEGLVADITWLVSMVVVVVGLASFALAGITAARHGKSR